MKASGLTLAILASGAAAAAPPKVLRPGPCASPLGSYLLAPNSGALIRVDGARPDGREERVVVFRPQALRGWASQRLLRRFDLKIEDAGVTIVNTGGFCSEQAR